MKFKELPKESISYVTSGIRMGFSRSERYRLEFKKDRIEWRDGNRKRVSNKCNLCKGKFQQKDMRLDHEPPVVPLDSSIGDIDIIQYIKNVYFGSVQKLCKECHNKKTKEENAIRRKHKNAKNNNISK